MRYSRVLTVSLSLLFPLAACAATQTACQKAALNTPAYVYCELIDAVNATHEDARKGASLRLAHFYLETQLLPEAMNYSMLDAIFQHAQDTRVDKQTGAPASAAGASSLVSLPGATDLLSVAVQSGSLTESTSGTTTTVGANVGQLVEDLAQPARFDYTLRGIPVLQNLNATISLGTSPTSTNVAITTDSTGATPTTSSTAMTSLGSTTYQVTGATVRYQIFNRFDPHSAQFHNSFQKALSDQNSALSKASQNAAKTANELSTVFDNNVSDAVADHAEARFVASVSLLDLVNAFNAYFHVVTAKVSTNPTFKSKLAAFASAMSADLAVYRGIVNTAKGIPALTAEYTYSNTAGQPVTHNGRLIYGFQGTDGRMLTFNAAATFYGPLQNPAVVSHFRDCQVSAQGDLPIAASATNHAIDLSVAGYGQYQQSASILAVSSSDLPSGFPANAPTFVAGTKGWLGVAQVKLTVKAPGGVQVTPLSWKWANRTDVFAQADSTFQFGLSYDVSSLAQVFGLH